MSEPVLLGLDVSHGNTSRLPAPCFPAFMRGLGRKYMHRFLLFVTGCLAVCAAQAASPQVHDRASAFVAFWDRTRHIPIAGRVALFKREIAPTFAPFYGIERYEGERTAEEQDRVIEHALLNFGPIRDAFIDKANGAEQELERHVATITKHFPDYRPDIDIYLVHSLGEMNGGPRTLAGRDYLIFGLDVMAKLHGTQDESAFYQHELFHTYHQQRLGDCDSGQVWSSLWKEGLATHVSKVLNPAADERALQLDFPAGMPSRTRAVLPKALAQLRDVWASEDGKTWGGLFHTRTDDGTGLPGRRGYYLGFLVAREAGKRFSLQELARLDCSRSRTVALSALESLLRDAATPGKERIPR